MRTLSQPNYANPRKYTAADLAEVAEREAEEAARMAEFDAEMAERKATVLAGLVKYGFSEAGAKVLGDLIAQGVDYSGDSHLDKAIRTGRIAFATEEKAQAAQRAFDYYWK